MIKMIASGEHKTPSSTSVTRSSAGRCRAVRLVDEEETPGIGRGRHGERLRVGARVARPPRSGSSAAELELVEDANRTQEEEMKIQLGSVALSHDRRRNV